MLRCLPHICALNIGNGPYVDKLALEYAAVSDIRIPDPGRGCPKPARKSETGADLLREDARHGCADRRLDPPMQRPQLVPVRAHLNDGAARERRGKRFGESRRRTDRAMPDAVRCGE